MVGENSQNSKPIDLETYDEVVRVLVNNPGISFSEVEKRTGAPWDTVLKIWDGRIARPKKSGFRKLLAPRRCPKCGRTCSEWPCRTCEMNKGG